MSKTKRKFKFPSRKKPLVVKVSRRRWVNAGARAKGISSLLNSHGNMCCLGFACRAMGFKPSEIRLKASPESLLSYRDDRQRYGINTIPGLVVRNEYGDPQNTVVADEIIEVNDNHASYEEATFAAEAHRLPAAERRKKAKAFRDERERKIQRIGKKIGIKFIFTN